VHVDNNNYLSVADNAGDAVLLHVSASSERQEFGNKIGLKKRRTKHHILQHIDVYGFFSFTFCEKGNCVLQSI
jgi:hypothetical protein